MMVFEREPHVVIADMVAARRSRPDAAILEELADLPPLRDEDHPCWEGEQYWRKVACPYLALATIARERRLKPAIGLLLDRACFGDPGEMMRGLRHTLEGIIAPEWPALADICIEKAQSRRPGTRLWAIDQLVVLDDPRAKSIFEEALASEHEEIRWRGEVGLQRLMGQG